jgi:hypothetical protein
VQRRVDLIEIEEFGDLSRRPSRHMVMEQMRSGKPLSEFDPDLRKNHLFGEYQPALTALAEFAGLTINRATVREPPDDCMALEASWRGGSVGMSADGHAYRQAHRCFVVQPGPWGNRHEHRPGRTRGARGKAVIPCVPTSSPAAPSPIMRCLTTPAPSAR